jgi:hypothetical protein
MLSDHERRELALIEQGLEADPRLAASLGGHRRQRRWLIRLLTGLGILLIVTGLLTSTGGLVLQGLLAVGGAVAWSRWRVWRTARGRRAPP